VQAGRHDDLKPERIPVCLIEPHPLAAVHLKSTLLAGNRFTLLNQNDILGGPDAENSVPCVFVIDIGFFEGSVHGYILFLRSRIRSGRLLIIGAPMASVDLCGLVMLGIHGFISYEDVSHSLGAAIDAIWRGRLWIPTGALESIPTYVADFRDLRKRPTGLTEREKLVLEGLAEKLSNKELARELNISERTVKFHLENIFSKLEVHDRHSASRIALTSRLSKLHEHSPGRMRWKNV